MNIEKNSISRTEFCQNYSENNDCGRVTFEEINIDENIEYYFIRIRLIHIRGVSYIFHYFVTNLGSIIEFNKNNSYACETIEKPFKLDIK